MDVLNGHTGVTHTHRHAQKTRARTTHTDTRTENTQYAEPNQDENNDFSYKKSIFFDAPENVTHSRIFILRVELSSVRKEKNLQYQLSLRHLSSTAVVSTQNLDLPGFHPHPGFRVPG